ncbi:prepilin peptidase [Chloroflexota bacterium]
MIWLIYILFGILGLSVGSFLNVCIDRLPAGGSLLFPPSRCDTCGKKLTILDLVPVVSYLFLRGRCRYCQNHIPVHSIMVELITGLLFVVALAVHGPNLSLATTVVYGSLFIVIIFIDAEKQLILNKIIYPAGWGLPVGAVFGYLYSSLTPGILGGLLGAAIGFGFFLAVYLIYPKGLGAGDVKLAGFIGLVSGFPLLFVSLFIGIVLGGLIAIIILIARPDMRRKPLPYGAFLGIGPIITLLWGNQIFNWYWGQFF